MSSSFSSPSSSSSAKASSSSLSASSSSSSSSETIRKDDIIDFNNKIAGNFFYNNAKKLGEYIEGDKVSGKYDALKSRIDLLTLSELKQPDIRDPDLQFLVLISPQNSNPEAQIYTLYQINGRNIRQKQYITNNAGQIAGVLFTYIDDEQLAVDMNELYYKTAAPSSKVAASKAKPASVSSNPASVSSKPASAASI
jgi:hypothetical protein